MLDTPGHPEPYGNLVVEKFKGTSLAKEVRNIETSGFDVTFDVNNPENIQDFSKFVKKLDYWVRKAHKELVSELKDSIAPEKRITEPAYLIGMKKNDDGSLKISLLPRLIVWDYNAEDSNGEKVNGGLLLPFGQMITRFDAEDIGEDIRLKESLKNMTEFSNWIRTMSASEVIVPEAAE